MHTHVCMYLSRVLSRLREGGDANASRGLLPTGNFIGGGGIVRSTLEETFGDGSGYSQLLAEDSARGCI